MELKPGYKQTEVGVIPEDWDAIPLGKLYKFSNGVNADKAAYGKGLRFINVLEPITYSHIRGPEITGLVELTSQVASAYTVNHGDIVFNRTSETDTELGMAAVYLGHEKVVFGGFVIRGQAISDDLDPTYAGYALRGEIVRDQIIPLGQGAVRANIGQESLRKVRVLVPPEHEQKLIAEALQDIDSLLTNIQESLYKKRQIKQAAMQELLTGKRRLPGFEGEWEVKRLGDVAHIKTGSKNNEDKAEDGEYPFFVRSENVERIGSYSYDCEAVLVPGEGRIGDIFHYIKGRFDVHQRVYAITQFTQEVSGKFVHCYLAMNFGAWAMQNTVKATVDSLRLPTFLTFEMRLPPTKEEQDSIVGVITEIDAELATLEARKVKVQMQKQGMMQQLLTGKIRLT
jgi:type I restriction enzyme S subunit